MRDYFKVNSEMSMMRLGVFFVIKIIGSILTVSGCFIGYMQVLKGSFDWYGFAAFIGGLATLFSTVLFSKANQKKYEKTE